MAAATALRPGDRAARLFVPATLLAGLALGCVAAPLPTPFDEPRALRIRDVADEGDPQRRASTRLVLDGLSAAAPEHAVSQYERAIRTDPTNPYAFLALAAYQIQWGDASRGVETLAQARQLFDPEQVDSPRVAPHFDGLRGRAMLRRDDASGRELLARAARAAPSEWGDGWLEASELR